MMTERYHFRFGGFRICTKFLGAWKKILCNEEVKGLENEEPEGGLEF